MSLKRLKDQGLKGKVKIALFSIIPTLLLIGAADFIAWGTITRRFYEAEDSLTGFSFYRLEIGRFPWKRTSLTPLNSLGYPDDEFVNILPKGECKHVVFAGDSYVFGDGVDRELSFVQLVRGWSERRNRDRCIRFFNVAQRSTTSFSP